MVELLSVTDAQTEQQIDRQTDRWTDRPRQKDRQRVKLTSKALQRCCELKMEHTSNLGFGSFIFNISKHYYFVMKDL